MASKNKEKFLEVVALAIVKAEEMICRKSNKNSYADLQIGTEALKTLVQISEQLYLLK